MYKFIERFNDTILYYMSEKNLSTTSFAKEVGCLERCVARWLNGTNIPSLEYVILVANYINCSIDYLFGIKETSDYCPSALTQTFKDRFDLLLKERMADNHKITKMDLAEFCGVGSSCVSKWTIRNQLPNPAVIGKLAEYFGVSIDYLVGRSDRR